MQRQIPFVIALDGLALGDKDLGLIDARLQILGILFELRHASVQGLESLAQAGGFACAGFEVDQAFGEPFFLGPQGIEVGAFVANLLFDLGVLRFRIGFLFQRLRQPLDVQIGLLDDFAHVAIFAGGQWARSTTPSASRCSRARSSRSVRCRRLRRSWATRQRLTPK